MKNVGLSVLQKLKNHSRETGTDMPTLLRRYVQERLLYRLSVSEDSDDFCLKGGVLLSAYNDGDLLRPTEDIDFNGFDGRGTVDKLRAALDRILAMPVEDDGVRFDAASIRIIKDRVGVVPGGKVTLDATVGTARVDVKVDVGFGNAITPEVRRMTIPTLLPGAVPRPDVFAYPLETVVAEKLHAMAQFGMANTRIKDHYDLLMLSRSHAFDGELMVEALSNTFRHQRREIPETFSGLSEEYAEANARRWAAFVRAVAPGLDVAASEALREVSGFVEPFAAAARDGTPAPGKWEPGSGWSGGDALRM